MYLNFLIVIACAGAGAVAFTALTYAKKKSSKEAASDYRNTEIGKQAKNSKGIFYSNGNYEAFIRPKKPEGIDSKSAYIVGSGLASLAAACLPLRSGTQLLK